MRKTVLLLLFAEIFVSCATSTGSVETSSIAGEAGGQKETAKSTRSPKLQEWNEIELPVSAGILVDQNGRILALSSDGFAAIDKDLKVTKLPPLVVEQEYLSFDGGLTRKRMEPQSDRKGRQALPRLCSPVDAWPFGERIVVFSICEHTTQIWYVTFDKKQTSVTVTNFTYRDSEGLDMNVLGPTRLPANAPRPLFPSFVDKGPAILTIGEGDGDLEVEWQGKAEDGGIASIDFVNGRGLMLLGGGKILISSDKGRTWRQFSRIPEFAEDKVMQMRFRNIREGYITGSDGLFLKTSDGGNTWKRENINSKTTWQVDLNDRMVAVAGFFGELQVKRVEDERWTRIQTKPEGHVESLLIRDNRLYITVIGKLYYLEI